MTVFGTYRTAVVERLDDVPQTPDEGLRPSGWTVVLPFLVRLRRGVELDTIDGALGFDPADDAYLGILWPGHGVRATALRTAEPLDSVALGVPGTRRGALRLSAMWVSAGHLLVTAPLVFRSRNDFDIPRAGRVEADFDTMLQTLAALRTQPARHWLTVAVTRWVGTQFDDRHVVASCRPVHDAVATDLWDLRGSNRDDDQVFNGVEEGRRFAWQISALKSHGVRHVLERGRWRDQRRELVANELAHGYTFLNDHLATANASACVEVCNVLNADLTPSVHDRLIRWGYDSSAVFIWTLELLRGGIARDLMVDYGERLADLFSRVGLEAREHSDLMADVLHDSTVAEHLTTLPRRLREGRNRALQEEIAAVRRVDLDIDELKADLDRVVVFARDLRGLEEQRRATRSSLLFACFAAALAAVGLPQVVQVIADFIRDGQPIEFSVSLLLTLGVTWFALLAARSWISHDEPSSLGWRSVVGSLRSTGPGPGAATARGTDDGVR